MFKKGIWLGVVVALSLVTVVVAQTILGSLPVNVTVVEAPAGVHFWNDDLGTDPFIKLWLGTERQQYTQTETTLYVTSDTPIGVVFSVDATQPGPVSFSPQIVAMERGVVYPVVVTFAFDLPGVYDFNIVATEQ